MKQMKFLTVNEATYEIVDAASRDRLTDAEVRLTQLSNIKGTTDRGIVLNDTLNNQANTSAVAFGSNTKAVGKCSISGGTTDDSLVEDIAGVDISILTDDLIVETLGKRGIRLKDNLTTNPSPTADGDVSIAFGTGNHSITAMSTTLGVGNEAGSKGFYLHKITVPDDGGNISISLSTEHKPYYKYSVFGSKVERNKTATWGSANAKQALASWSAGDKVNIILKKIYCLCESIVSVDSEKGIITVTNTGGITKQNVEDATVFDSLITAEASMLKLAPYQFSINVPTKPEVGTIELHFAGIATGLGSIAAGTLSQAHGLMNITAGQYGFVVGKQNEVGYGGFACGEGNKALGNNAHAEGYLTTASGNNSHAEGHSTVASSYRAHAEGYMSRATAVQSHAEGHNTEASGNVSHAEGYETVASGRYSHAEGQNTKATGLVSHAEGSFTEAVGDYSHVQGKYNLIDTDKKYAHIVGNGSSEENRSNAHTLDWKGNAWFAGDVHANDKKLATEEYVQTSYVTAGRKADTALGIRTTAEGFNTESSGTYSHAEGNGTIASGAYSHAEGSETLASGSKSHAEGYGTQSTGYQTHAEGVNTIASGNAAHAEGNGTQAIALNAHAEGYHTEASGKYSHAEGYTTVASGSKTHAEGGSTVALGDYSHAEGYETVASGLYSHTEGVRTTAYGESSHAEGVSTNKYDSSVHGTTEADIKSAWTSKGKFSLAFGKASHVEGNDSLALGDYSHAEGYITKALGAYSHAEGYHQTTASGKASHAEGIHTIASGESSHAEGNSTIASGSLCHAEGCGTEASSYCSHAEGYGTIASGSYSHAEGKGTIASGALCHAEGYGTIASGDYSHAEGKGTIASGNYSHVQGRYNIEDVDGVYAHIVGNGSSKDQRSNAHTLDWSGNAWFAGNLSIDGNMILNANQYGDTLPATGIQGQIFFLKKQ